MKIGVIGGGVVGQATANAFLEYVDDVYVHDIMPERSTHTLSDVAKCDVIFLCLPTPDVCGHLCTSSIMKALVQLKGSTKQIVLRSTVPIGTTRDFAQRFNVPNLIHSPEFLTARCANRSAQMPTRTVIGSMRNHGAYEQLLEKRYPHVPIQVVSPETSEAIKLATNAFFAVKIAFFNEVNHLCKSWGIEYDEFIHVMLMDPRISPSHTRVPGPDGRVGFGGACLPKDLKQFCIEQSTQSLSAPVSHAAKAYIRT
jgi:UDPglucose 6-dehydrogenase